MAKKRKKKKKYAGGGGMAEMAKAAGSAYYGGLSQLAGDIKSIKNMKVDPKTGAYYKKGGIIQHD